VVVRSRIYIPFPIRSCRHLADIRLPYDRLAIFLKEKVVFLWVLDLVF
jgi:hypothetical protein